MSSPFVWFHHNGEKSKETKKFFESLLAFQSSDGPAGEFTVVRDPGGAALALWKKA